MPTIAAEVAGKHRIATKGPALAADLAQDLGLDAPLLTRADRDHQAALGLGETDTASLTRAIEARTGVRSTD